MMLRLAPAQVERQMRPYLPGMLPSGWSRLTHRIVHRSDGVAVAAYGGFGCVVTIEAHPTEVQIRVERRRGEASLEEDLIKVELHLYRTARRSGRFRSKFSWQGRVAKFSLLP